jgi:hypothetical protein
LHDVFRLRRPLDLHQYELHNRGQLSELHLRDPLLEHVRLYDLQQFERPSNCTILHRCQLRTSTFNCATTSRCKITAKLYELHQLDPLL